MINIDLNSVKEQYKTNQTKKMNINWKQEIMTVYRIPLDLLYYNNRNANSVFYISKYNAENDVKLSNLPIEEQNRLIEQHFIDFDDNFLKLKDSIKKISQLEPWVVMYDGCIIDWNRRFACLRTLFKETWDQKYNFFETVILDKNITKKQIRELELLFYPFWKDFYRDFNPIVDLVWIYSDIIKNKRFTVSEYAKIVWHKIRIEKMVGMAQLMEDFLEYLNAPEEFYIAKELEIYWPLIEMYNIKRRLWDDEAIWNQVKIVLYDIILDMREFNIRGLNMKNLNNGDVVRTIRDFGKRILWCKFDGDKNKKIENIIKEQEKRLREVKKHEYITWIELQDS